MEVIKKEGVMHLPPHHSTIILTSEKQLERIIEGPDTPLFADEELGYSAERQKRRREERETVRTRCMAAAAHGCDRMEVSYDFFFGGSKRTFYPSDEITIKAFKVIHDTAKEYGMGFGASILNPLDIGGGWAKISDETGFSCQYLETEIRSDGSYCAEMSCQRQWYNNKGPIELIPHKVLAFAFREERVGDTPYFYVDENAIVDISHTASCTIETEKTEISRDGYGRCPMTISGRWEAPTADRVLCVMVYRTPELDYFAPSAAAFMRETMDRHNAAGITYTGFYSDEMHIQFDWDLERHFGETEINTRYLTPNLARVYAEKYGDKYRDFAKYLIYMAYHQHDFLPGEEGGENAQHVFGKTPEAINETWLFRNRYFELLQRTVVDLCCEARSYAEKLWGGPILTRAHATWQESPTCDHYYKQPNAIGGFDVQDQLGGEFADVTVESPIERRVALEAAKVRKAKELGITRYDYTPWYKWGASIRENIAACYDYFKWNEYFTGAGTDHAEGGNLDRNYYAQCLAASFHELNQFDFARCSAWGMPKKILKLFYNMAAAYGNWHTLPLSFATDRGTRRTDVLALYPIKLNNAEERFGSWMVQYGYCNYITEEKLLENASVTQDGCLCVKGQKFRCLVALFEPFLDERTFALLEKFLAAGGRVLWMSIPALYDNTGADAAERFRKLFGIDGIVPACAGEKHPGKKIRFAGSLAGVKDMTVPTDFIVDFVYPCTPAADAESVAMLDGKTVGVCKKYPGGGAAVYAGFRMRDDQSGSQGADVDTLFTALCAMGAYAPDSLEVRSRRADAPYMLHRFANGAISAAPHFRQVYESWEGKFFREKEYDDAILASRSDIPDGSIRLEGETLDGHAITFVGSGHVIWRLGTSGAPIALRCADADGITVDGVKYTVADRNVELDFAPVAPQFLAEGVKYAVGVYCTTENAVLTIPAAGEGVPQVLACRDVWWDPSVAVAHTWNGTTVSFTVTPELAGKNILIAFL